MSSDRLERLRSGRFGHDYVRQYPGHVEDGPVLDFPPRSDLLFRTRGVTRNGRCHVGQPRADVIEEAIVELARDQEERIRLSHRALQLVGGRGTERAAFAQLAYEAAS